MWYGLQRVGLYVPPAPSEPDSPTIRLPGRNHSIAELVTACRPELTPDAAHALAEECELLLFGRGERIALPVRLKGWSCLLLRGELVEP